MQLRTEIAIDAPAERVWHVLGEQFMHVAEWAAPIVASSAVGPFAPGVGAIRACTIAPFGPMKAGTVQERLTKFDPERMAFEYEALEGLPSFVSIREQNALLVAAGLPPAYPALSLEDGTMKPVQKVLERVLTSHEPFPAWVSCGGFRFISANRAAEVILPGSCSMSPEAIVELWFGPGPFRDLVENWQDVVWAGIAALRRETSRASDPQLTALLRRAEGYAKDIPEPEPDTVPDLPVVCPRLNIGGRRIRTISTVMRFDTAIEVTASELRVELMFPADEESERFFRENARPGHGWQQC